MPIEPPVAPLSDGVVIVRQRRMADLPFLAAAADDPEAERWLEISGKGEPPRTPDQIEEIWRRGESAPLLIADAHTDEPVGLINLQFRPDAEPSIAYRVFPAWRGHGFAAHALELVTEWALGALPALLLEIDERNVASIRVAERCGYRRTGTTTDDDPPKAVFRRVTPKGTPR